MFALVAVGLVFVVAEGADAHPLDVGGCKPVNQWIGAWDPIDDEYPCPQRPGEHPIDWLWAQGHIINSFGSAPDPNCLLANGIDYPVGP